MALFAIPNPTKEITIKRPIDNIQASIKEVVRSFSNYTLLEEDTITNRYRILIKETDAISKLALDMGQHLDITLNEINENSTKLYLEVSRVIGVIDQQHEANRATQALNTFLTLLSKSIEGKLDEVVERHKEIQKQNDEKSKSTNIVLWIIIAAIIAFAIYKIMQIRKENHASLTPIETRSSAYNKGFCASGARRCYFSYLQSSAVVPA